MPLTTRLRPWIAIFFCLFSLSIRVAAQDAAAVPPNSTQAPIGIETVTPPPDWTASPTSAAAAEIDLSEIERRDHHVLRRPIALSADKVHWADRTYPYGSTRGGTLAVHLGVEFVNPRFTPVYAAESGSVVFAGEDTDLILGPYKNYYGNVVILAHDIRSLDNRQIFTLYAHLDRVEAEAGQDVQAGERLGRVGSSGIALGAHLHFEVRVDDPYDYRLTRNPELWLKHYTDHGMIAGFVHDAQGNPIYGKRIVARSDTVHREVFTYGSDRANRDPVWNENFTVSDLPPGGYEIVILDEVGRLAHRSSVMVAAYQTTFVDVLIEN